ERFKQGRECNGSLKASERRRERYRLFFVVLVAVFSGGKFYHKFQLTATIHFWYKARNALDFFEVIEK
ncbi:MULTISPECIES: hypothetical protein, partial [Enterobacter cloacae complex]|uniref:hypothetical protein n=1 Tax=Enterobacter cloacae complex TaxID=354276 RepID=UPI00263B2DE1